MAFLLAKTELSLAQNLQQVPDWLLDNQRGDTLSFYKDSEGQASLLVFWTPACDLTCRKEINHWFKRARQQKLKAYLLVGSKMTAQTQWDELPSDIPLFTNARSVNRYYGATEQPKIVLINQHKEIVLHQSIQQLKSRAELEQAIEAIK